MAALATCTGAAAPHAGESLRSIEAGASDAVHKHASRSGEPISSGLPTTLVRRMRLANRGCPNQGGRA